MHSSKVLKREHFRFFHEEGGQAASIPFEAMFSDYHCQDRVAVVCPTLEDGVTAAPAALLALTTGFYDAMRARGRDFFDYPQHFCILAGGDCGICTRGRTTPLSPASYGAPWSTLDVWPETMWKIAKPDALSMMKAVFSLQVDRLFWPAHLAAPAPIAEGDRLPRYVHDILATRLKQVWSYGGDIATHRLEVRAPATELIEQSQAALRRVLGDSAAARASTGEYVERLQRLSVDQFLGGHEQLFASAAPAVMA